jgi:tol-pal system protein YbgF
MWGRGKGRLGLPSRALLLGGMSLVVAGCTGFTDEALQQDVSQLRRDVNTLMIAANRQRAESLVVSQPDRRHAESATESAEQAATLSARLDSFDAELNRLSARLDIMSQRVESLARQQPRAGITPTPTPVVPPPQATAPPPARHPAPERTSPLSSASAAPSHGASGAGAAQENYQAAYLDFSRGRYPLAVSEFRDFLRRFPDSPLADSAQYAIGESYFSMARASSAAGRVEKAKEEMEQAVQEFRRVLINYPRGSKVPTALYKEALALTELKQTTLAQARLQYLLDHFPQSEEAPLAKERLAASRQ